jgi:hypothetical protein
VIAITSSVSNVTAILGGIVVFNDPLGSNAFIICVRILAFALVIAAAAVMPGPVRAAGHRRGCGCLVRDRGCSGGGRNRQRGQSDPVGRLG